MKLPNDDKVDFEEFNINLDPVVDKYIEFINNDNDVYFLESNFPNLYSQVIQEG